MIYVNETESWYGLGGQGTRDTCIQYVNNKIKVRAQMPSEKTFFPAVYHKGVIYTFGGYDGYDKVQLNTCEYYDVKADKWYNSHAPSFKLHQTRSQASACLFDDQVMFVFGGYHKDEGTLNTIERFDIAKKKMVRMELRIPQPIRRFQSMKISTTKILLIGGLGRDSQELDAVFCFDLKKEYTIE